MKDFGPHCCVCCFDDDEVQERIRQSNSEGNCNFCGATDVSVAPVEAIADSFEPLLRDYQEVEEGVHYLHELDQDADGDPLDVLLAEDNPELFSSDLSDDARQELVQEIVNAIDKPDPKDGWYGRTVSELWIRPGNELWAGAEEEYFRSPDFRWLQFCQQITTERRFIRPEDPEIDPASYLTDAVLSALTIVITPSQPLFRAVLDGARDENGMIVGPHPASRMSGPRREHCRQGGRLNPPGIPVLYTATSAETAIAESRPWKGAPVSVATVCVNRDVRLVDLLPRDHPLRKAQGSDIKYVDGLYDVLSSIGRDMAEPVDPNTSEIRYVPTQYVAEYVRSRGYDGIRYASAMGSGANVVLFEVALATIAEVTIYAVTGVTYSIEREEELPF